MTARINALPAQIRPEYSCCSFTSCYSIPRCEAVSWCGKIPTWGWRRKWQGPPKSS